MKRISLLPIWVLLALLIGGAWTYLVTMAWRMRHMDHAPDDGLGYD
jgi:hypothetical protein